MEDAVANNPKLHDIFARPMVEGGSEWVSRPRIAPALRFRKDHRAPWTSGALGDPQPWECREAWPAMLAWTLRTVVLSLIVCGALAVVLAPGGLVERYITHELPGPSKPMQAAAVRAPPTPNENVYRRARDGHFYVEADVNGARIRFLVDTGATYVALSPDDARSAGLRVFDSDYTAQSSTANGVTRVAPVTLRQVELDQLQLFDVPAVVLEVPMPVSLLGMSFLSRLRGYETRNDELVLRW
jgi:aspartyl protease family protein